MNKVPSIIMLPVPPQSSENQLIRKSAITSSNSLPKISSLKCNLITENIEIESGTWLSQNCTLTRSKSKKDFVNVNEKVISSKGSSSSVSIQNLEKFGTDIEAGQSISKQRPILTTLVNCTNPKEHFLPSEASMDDDYLSECENCKTSGTAGRFYLNDEELDEPPLQETMTLQRKLMSESEETDQQNYYRVSSTLPTNTNKKVQ